MNAEQLHDALNQLPDDLLAAADTLRLNRKKPVAWKRWVPAAACLVLVLGALYVAAPYLGFRTASKEAAVMQDAAMSEMEMLADAETNAVAGEPEAPAAECPAEAAPEAGESGRGEDNSGAPLAPETEEQAESTAAAVVEVTSFAYCIGSEEPDETQIAIISTAGEWDAYLAENPRLADAEDFKNPYDEAYFEKKQLIVVVTTAASSSVRYEVDGIVETGTGTWELTITRFSPEEFTDDMTQQCILVELPRTVEPEDTVILNLEQKAE